MATVKVDPAPGRLSRATRPPWARAMPRTMARPRPAVPGRRAPSAVRAKRSKIWSCWSAGMPGPVSRTHSRASPSLSADPISIVSPGAVWRTALSARFMTAWVRRWGSASTMPSPVPASRQSRSARDRLLPNRSLVSRSRSTASGCRKSGRSARASTRRSPTMRAIRSSSSSTTARVARRSSGSSDSSSTWPRMIVIGVRSSWPASSRKRRWLAKAPSSRSSMSLKVRASSATSSLVLGTSMRRLRSVADSSWAVSVTARTGASTRPAISQARASATSRTPP